MAGDKSGGPFFSVDREFDFGEQGKFKLELYDGFVVRGRHLCAERVIDHAQAYAPEGVPIRFRTLSKNRATIFCSACPAHITFSVNTKEFSRKNLEKTLSDIEFKCRVSGTSNS